MSTGGIGTLGCPVLSSSGSSKEMSVSATSRRLEPSCSNPHLGGGRAGLGLRGSTRSSPRRHQRRRRDHSDRLHASPRCQHARRPCRDSTPERPGQGDGHPPERNDIHRRSARSARSADRERQPGRQYTGGGAQHPAAIPASSAGSPTRPSTSVRQKPNHPLPSNTVHPRARHPRV
jgi:hypothetical protein